MAKTTEEAYLKSLYSTGITLKEKIALISIGGIVHKKKFLESIQSLIALGFKLYATETTHKFLRREKIFSKFVYKVHQNKHPNVVDIINRKKVALVITITDPIEEEERFVLKAQSDKYLIRRAAIDNDIPLFTDLHNARLFVKALSLYESQKDLDILSWKEYISS